MNKNYLITFVVVLLLSLAAVFGYQAANGTGAFTASYIGSDVEMSSVVSENENMGQGFMVNVLNSSK